MKLGIIGTGLIGGSLALALKKRRAEKYEISCYNRSIETSKKAFELGAVDKVCDSIEELAEFCDVIIIATPVGAYKNIFKIILPRFSSEKVLTDCGSIKSIIYQDFKDIFPPKFHSNFIPCHPIAGKEVGGLLNADADLFLNKTNIITLEIETQQSSIVREVWTDAGMVNKVMEAQKHDDIFAKISHFPQFLSFMVEKYISKQSPNDPDLSSFLRLTKSPKNIWLDIFKGNSVSLEIFRKAFIKSFEIQSKKFCAMKNCKNQTSIEDDKVLSSLIALSFKNIISEEELDFAGSGCKGFLSILDKNILQKQECYSKNLERNTLDFLNELKKSNISRYV